MNGQLLRHKKLKYLIYDFETVSLSLFPHSEAHLDKGLNLPWQLGWAVFDGDANIVQREDWILWPDLVEKMLRIGKDAAALTGWTEYEYTKRATDPVPTLDAFEKYLYDPSVISISANGWNMDQYLHNIYRQRLGRKADWSWTSRHYDIQTVHKAKVLEQTPARIGTRDWVFFNTKMSQIVRKGLKSNLGFMAKECGVPYDEFRHHKEALYDVELTWQIFNKQIQDIDIYV